MPDRREVLAFLRYPGGKRRILSYLCHYIQSRDEIADQYVEPFVGGGAVFFFVQPRKALLADVNHELVDLYRGIRRDPHGVWKAFKRMPEGKTAYNRIRALKHGELNLVMKAARLLYLNRTCFKGMWRHNGKGEFNVGYGGPSRRWVITAEDLVTVSKLLHRASLRCSDFEEVIDGCTAGDFVFADPPYRPGHKELSNQHYVGQVFTFQDHKRLALALARAQARGVSWTMTNSAHPDILDLYRNYQIRLLARGPRANPAVLTQESGEAIITSALPAACTRGN